MKNIIVLIVLSGCVNVEMGESVKVIKPGSYTEQDVKDVMEIVFSVVESDYQSIREDINDFGYYIRFFNTDEFVGVCPGEHSGCTDGTGYVAVLYRDGDCIGDTALVHELLHLYGLPYGRSQVHGPPVFMIGSSSQEEMLNTYEAKALRKTWTRFNCGY